MDQVTPTGRAGSALEAPMTSMDIIPSSQAPAATHRLSAPPDDKSSSSGSQSSDDGNHHSHSVSPQRLPLTESREQGEEQEEQREEGHRQEEHKHGESKEEEQRQEHQMESELKKEQEKEHSSPSVPQALPQQPQTRSDETPERLPIAYTPMTDAPLSRVVPDVNPQPQQQRQQQRQQQSRNFPSPNREYAHRVSSFSDDASRLAATVERSCPEAVRQVVRDHWQKSILGSDYHQAFLLNYLILHTNGRIIRRALQEFGDKMVAEAGAEIIQHFQPSHLDGMFDTIMAKASDRFLDRILEKRLRDIPARSLINALARSERLGYESSDIVEDNPEEKTAPAQSTPNLPQQPQPQQTQHQQQHQHQHQHQHQQLQHQNQQYHQQHPQQYPPQYPQQHPQQHPQQYPQQHPQQQHPQQHPQYQHQPPPPPQRPSPSGGQQMPQVQHAQPSAGHPLAQGADLQCRLCWRKFQSSSAYSHHVQKEVCTKAPPKGMTAYTQYCPHCGTGFVTKVGLQYHTLNKVCGDHEALDTRNAPAPHVPAPSLPPSAYKTFVTTNGGPVWPRGIRPDKNVPTQAPSPSPSSALPSGDPYGQLTPQQREALEEDLRQVERDFRPRFEEAQRLPNEQERKSRLESLHNSFSTKQSMTRKKHGVRLRVRRTQAEIEAERARAGIKRPSEEGTPSIKRPRTDYQPQPYHPSSSQPYYPSSSQPSAGPSPTPATPTPARHLAVSDMSSGLGGSNGTAATADPTLNTRPNPALTTPPVPSSQPSTREPLQFTWLAGDKPQPPSSAPHNSLGSMQRKGMRVSSHVPGISSSQPSRASPASSSNTPVDKEAPPNSLNDTRNGSASAPIAIGDDDSSSSDSEDDDDEIPAIPRGAAQLKKQPA